MPAPDFSENPVQLARALIGAALTLDGVGGIIVETEAYAPDDPASHSFSGRTPRNAAMFGPPGRAYVYRSYGLHWCLNVVCGERPGGAVLLRALEPRWGLEQMAQRRGLADIRRLCAGPGRLCQALAVTSGHDGAAMTVLPFALALATTAPGVEIGQRIGISKAVDRPWRFGLAGSPFLSRALNPSRSPS
jgi:DNA-3-methyladenine glycosylase